MASFDPLKATAAELQDMLQRQLITSVEIVDVYLDQIERHNHNGLKLNAVISVASREVLLQRAECLDRERHEGRARSALHGIPIILKDSIVTDAKLGMPTTNGSFAFKDAIAMRNAKVVDILVDAGMIILAKANLTEASGMKSPAMLPGWSLAGGQTQTPYVAVSNEAEDPILGNSRPGGSSAGSAVSVAAGFAPLALGTEAVGSVITPGNRAGLYALKITPGDVSNDGIFGISTTFDSIGGMAKSAGDLASLTAVLLRRPLDFQKINAKADLAVGFVDPREWRLPQAVWKFDQNTEEQTIAEFDDAIVRMQTTDLKIVHPIKVPSPDVLKPDKDEDPYRLIAYHQCQDIFANVAAIFENNSIHTVADMVKWNEDNESIALPKDLCPDQKDLTETLAFPPDPAANAALHARFRRLGCEGVNPVFDEYDIDIIAAPADSSLVCFAAAAGYPIGLVPLSVIKGSGRPFGVCVLARAGQEESLLRFMREWEKVYPDRPLPKPMMEA